VARESKDLDEREAPPFLISTISVSGKIFGFPITRDQFAPVAVNAFGFPITRLPDHPITGLLYVSMPGSKMFRELRSAGRRGRRIAQCVPELRRGISAG
jgi:hypothetical protein